MRRAILAAALLLLPLLPIAAPRAAVESYALVATGVLEATDAQGTSRCDAVVAIGISWTNGRYDASLRIAAAGGDVARPADCPDHGLAAGTTLEDVQGSPRDGFAWSGIQPNGCWTRFSAGPFTLGTSGATVQHEASCPAASYALSAHGKATPPPPQGAHVGVGLGEMEYHGTDPWPLRWDVRCVPSTLVATILGGEEGYAVRLDGWTQTATNDAACARFPGWGGLLESASGSPQTGITWSDASCDGHLALGALDLATPLAFSLDCGYLQVSMAGELAFV